MRHPRCNPPRDPRRRAEGPHLPVPHGHRDGRRHRRRAHRQVAGLGRGMAGVPVPEPLAERHRRPRGDPRPRRGPDRPGPPPLPGGAHRQVRRATVRLQPAAPRRLPQSQHRGPPSRPRLPAARALHLPERRDGGERRHPYGLAPAHGGHPRRPAHPQLRRLRPPLRPAGRRRRSGRVDRRLPPRRLPPLHRLDRQGQGPVHAARRLQVGSRGVGRLPGLAVQGPQTRVVPLRAGGHGPPAHRARGSPPPATPTGPRRPWPAWPTATPSSTSHPGARRSRRSAPGASEGERVGLEHHQLVEDLPA